MSAKANLSLRVLVGFFGVLLLVQLIRKTGPANLLHSITTLGWGLALVIAWGGVAHLLKTWAWRVTLLDEKRQVSFARMLGLRLGSEAVGQLGFLGQMFGEGLRVSLLSSTIPAASGIASVTLDRALFTVTAAVVSTGGLIALLLIWPLPHKVALYASVFAAILVGFNLAAALAFRKRWAVLSGSAQILSRVRHVGAWVERRRSLIHAVEHRLLDFYHQSPRAFWGSFALNLIYHGTAILEVYLILWLMGAKISLIGAFAIEALTKLVNLVGLFNPGNLGTYEGGNMLIAKMFRISAAAGLTLGLTRRVRALFWAAIGGVALTILSKSRKNMKTPSTPTLARANGSHTAVIIADNLVPSGGSELPEVGALPILLRAILQAQKAGAARTVVVVSAAEKPVIVRALQRTGRVPLVDWFETGTPGCSLLSVLEHVATQGNRVVLIAGDTTYHPSLQRRAAEWDGESDALTFTSGDQLVGIYVLNQPAVKRLTEDCATTITCLAQLDDCLVAARSVECESVDESKWQRVRSPEDRLAAERKLDSWLVKPTDGIFARTNRKISIPISRQLIKLPITPNMVSLFTLGVSFLSGLYFARGGYWNLLAGAVLSLFASILDGSDGEVARLKLMESDFGCWLETICDYLYYLFIFVGMAIGLTKTRGSQGYLIWGAVLLTGAILSFLVTAFQRQHLTNGRPEQLLSIWQAQADKRRSNPFLYFGRHLEFIVRRCFLPYAFLFFALFNILRMAFIGAAVGANVVWILAVYSHFAFSAPTSRVANPPATA